MNVFLWIVQVVLAGMFAMAGVMKVAQSKDKLVEKLPWVADFSAGTVRFIGIVELAGALGLILPAATGIATVLTPLAAVGLGATMLLAATYHARKKEFSAIGFNAVLLVLAVLVAWGRFGPYGL
ncbi:MULTISPECIES: DoxX family protein [unclassified Pseudonocardia]|uniref:DoxX family protein n=1 Tax=unclassified Pseudonocardia TaxID=2619320 RepID=UPI001CF6A768|nr:MULTISPECIES: DoxX family protein [unclassified Pseudonocardia]